MEATHHPWDGYVIHDVDDVTRLHNQESLYTRAMGGLFPAGLDVSAMTDLLDLGCGPGEWVCQVAHEWQAQEMHVVGVDNDASTIEYARAFAQVRHVQNVTFRVMDITARIAFDDELFDLVNGRFLCSFLSSITWPSVLREAWRVLQPGGICLLSESEYGTSNSRAVQQLAHWFFQAMRVQGRSFSLDGHSLGLAHMLYPLLHETGFTAITSQAFVLNGSYGTPLYASHTENLIRAFAKLKPFVLAAGVVDETAYDACYEQALDDMQIPAFASLSFGLSVWGVKPEKAAFPFL